MECEIHICPILMRTVRFIDGSCDSQDESCDDCPVMDSPRKDDEVN